MPQNYVPVFIFIAVVGTLIPITFLLTELVGPTILSGRNFCPTNAESIRWTGHGRFTVRYYIVAILFVVFDVETIFLFPWAVRIQGVRALWAT